MRTASEMDFSSDARRTRGGFSGSVRMMKWMPVLFTFMLYNYASALALYMCVSSAWGIAESKLVRRAIAKLD